MPYSETNRLYSESELSYSDDSDVETTRNPNYVSPKKVLRKRKPKKVANKPLDNFVKEEFSDQSFGPSDDESVHTSDEEFIDDGDLTSVSMEPDTFEEFRKTIHNMYKNMQAKFNLIEDLLRKIQVMLEDRFL